MTCANFLSVNIFICCFTAAVSIRELIPHAEYLKKSSEKCSSKPKTVANSYILPFESSFLLECGEICTKKKDSIPLKHLWFFQPSDELKVYNLLGNDNKNYVVTENGALEIERITRKGVFYCTYSGTIYAMYSISPMSTKFLKPVETGNFLNKPFVFFDNITGQLSTVKKFQTNCSTSGKIGIKRYIYQHEVSFTHAIEKVSDAAVLKILRFKSISMFDFKIIDSELMKSLSRPNLPDEAIVYQYSFCSETRSEKPRSNAEEFTYQQLIARNQIFKTKFKNIRESALLSCAFKGVKEYRWKKISKSNGSRSQWLSAHFLHKNTGDRIRIDFLNNLHFEQLQMEDYNYRYVCYYEDKPIVSFAFKLNLALSSVVELLPKPDIMTIICVALSTIIIFWTILSSPDISSKL